MHNVVVPAKLRSDPQLLHQCMRDPLPGFGPDPQKLFKPVADCLILAGETEPKNRLGVIGGKDFKGGGRRCIRLGEQNLCETGGQRVKTVPFRHETWTQHQLLERGKILGRHTCSQQLHLGRGHIGMNPLKQQFDRQGVQGRQLLFIGLGHRPGREQVLHPAFAFQRPKHLQPVFLVTNLFKFLDAHLRGQMFNNPFALRILVTGLGPWIKLPPQSGYIAGGANHQRGLLKKAVIRDQSQRACFNVRSAV